MRCPACRTEAPAGAAYCPQCGQRMANNPGGDSPAGGAGPARPGPRVSRNDPEVDLWRGGYSPKAMIPSWVFCGLVTLAGIAVGLTVHQQGAWLAIAGALALLWGYHVLLLAYRRLSISYRLTSQRFFHETGILRRQINRIEMIDIDDIGYEQGVVDRLLGTGTICISSSDTTDPRLLLYGIDQVREIAAKLDDARRKERLRRGMFIESV